MRCVMSRRPLVQLGAIYKMCKKASTEKQADKDETQGEQDTRTSFTFS